MLANQNLINYLAAIQAKIDSGEKINRKGFEIIENSDIEREIAQIVDMQGLDYCDECGEDITWMTQEGHIIFKNGDDIIVAVCCEGYHQIQI